MSRRTIPKRVSSYDRDAPTPAIGSRWVWEPRQPFARETITVTEVEWNGEEWWVQTGSDRPAPRALALWRRGERRFWNDLSRFWEAVEPI
jgi:hypothetical protein